ncbi:MAG: helix-turn-helix domain-containing protein [Oscillatoriales cyanobacterium]|nr:MAG: helix-turn-helix domain-containing protein [Oscillatoriales cyanobacterium]TAD92973.1 MAG: helix-turn-helix domain-containing protein [Oscillatoriales cyanobacterium]TAE02094.1 MAG: helix-turn-helix domain-containing protein [Oscillatoriales cyanobacterium]TAF05232.1 MAG: helix-turn-helix domain-containing protein [Oscillatoriales cyanobacterium]TAF63027.1 MAG: helix-turn-helix domain-containing protein [Oscillatoriales cyanobacterium]
MSIKRCHHHPTRVFLNCEEEQTLWELRKVKNIAARTKDRAETVRLSAQRWRVEKISHYLKCSPNTVRSTLHRWKEKGLEGLWDAPRPGRNPKWLTSDIAAIEEKLEIASRYFQRCNNYTSLINQQLIQLNSALLIK